MTLQPTANQVRQLLAPWRSLQLRKAATSIWRDRFDEAVWLRTHYPAGGDAQFAEWREADADNDPDADDENLKSAWTCLDDAALFDFGDNWCRVFDILPELAGPVQGYVRCGFEGDGFGVLRAQLRDACARLRDGAERDAEAETGAAGMALQVMAVNSFLIVADAEAWETGLLRLLYLDARGNVVRHSRIAPEDVMYTRSEWFGKKFRDGRWWVDARGRDGLVVEPGGVLGDMYTARGEMGRVLYGLE